MRHCMPIKAGFNELEIHCGRNSSGVKTRKTDGNASVT